ncbi:MAG: M20/M25/M40 family metallo-hydrolase [Bryobacteraceae bacterium]
MIADYVQEHQQRLIEILSHLVKIPSENRAPSGAEMACQQYVAKALQTCRWKPEIYRPDEVPGILGHSMYWPGRNYEDRCNVAARRKGSGGGRSLILSGHVDTVPVGSQPWQHDPFGAEIDGNRLYGRGATDMKCGIASNLFIVEAIADLDPWQAILLSVVDEEFGGGTAR